MAKSLVCKDCGKLLASIKEAQDHGELTGHSNFEETTIAIKVVVCTNCGKPCRTDAEQKMHSRANPGHDSFVDKTEDAPVLDSEKQMAAARAEAMDVDEEGGKKGAAAEDGEVEAQEMVPAEVDQAMLKELEGMGFPAVRATRALHFSGGGGVEGAVNWLVDHGEDADIDEPLMVPKEDPNRPKLTPEEARLKAEELMRKAKARREREEKEAERVRELARIRAGKELQLAKRKEDEGAMRRLVEQRRMEKEEEARAKEKIKAKLEEDRKERRRKLGLPEELTEEERAKEAAKAEAERKAVEDKKAAFVASIKPITQIQKMRGLLVDAKKANPGKDAEFKTACATLAKYIGNIAAQPEEEKFRTIKLGNAAFQSRVACMKGTLEFLEAVGFQRTEEALTMPRDKVASDMLTAAQVELDNALNNPFFGVL